MVVAENKKNVLSCMNKLAEPALRIGKLGSRLEPPIGGDLAQES